MWDTWQKFLLGLAADAKGLGHVCDEVMLSIELIEA